MSNLHYIYLFFLGLFAPTPHDFGQSDNTQTESVIQTVHNLDDTVSTAQCAAFPECLPGGN